MDKPNLKDVLVNLRSLTQSVKGGVPIDRLQRDYRDFLGGNIPFRELGHSSLDAFLRSIPHVIQIVRGPDGQMVAQGVADSTTAHIVSLVSRQKVADTRRKGRRAPIASRRFPSRYSSRGGYSSTNSFLSRPTGRPPLLTTPSSRPIAKPVRRTSASRPEVRAQDVFPSTRKEPIVKVSPYFDDENRTVDAVPRDEGRESWNNVTESSSFKIKEPTPPVRPTPVAPPSHKEYAPSRKYELAPRFQRLQLKQQEKVETPPPYDAAPAVCEPPKPKPQPKKPQLPSTTIDRTKLLSEALDRAKTAKEYVDIYAKMNNIQVVYQTFLMGQRSKGFISSLSVGDKKYKSYPEVRSNETEAEEEAAKNAMADIKENRALLATLPETPYGNADEIQTLLFRIEEIVWEKPSGMFANGIVREYENKFSERLPNSWLELLKQSNSVDIEALDVPYGKIPEGADIIIRPSKELSSGNATPSSTSSKSETSLEPLDSKALESNLVKISQPKVDDIEIPAGNVWFVYITCVKDAIFARLLDYDEKFIALTEEMGELYRLKPFPAQDIFENQVYALCEEDNPEIWHRAIVDEIKDDMVSCYLADVGETLTVRKENLQEILPRFLSLPFQAVLITLDGLEDYEQCIKPEYLEDDVLGRTLVAEVKRWWPNSDFLPDHSGVHKVEYSVILYDTSSNDETDVNINESLKSTILLSLRCELPKQSLSSCAYLSHVTPDGKVFLRLTHPLENLIEIELEKLAQIFEAAALRNSSLPENTMCAAKCADGKWHRVVITKCSSPSKVEVNLVDFGSNESVPISNLCELQPINSELASVPYQTVMCELFDALPSPDAKWTDLAVQKLKEMVPPSEEVMIRVMFESEKENLAKVNLYKRNKESDIISINQTLCLKPDLFRMPFQSCRKSSNENLPRIPRHLKPRLL